MHIKPYGMSVKFFSIDPVKLRMLLSVLRFVTKQNRSDLQKLSNLFLVDARVSSWFVKIH